MLDALTSRRLKMAVLHQTRRIYKTVCKRIFLTLDVRLVLGQRSSAPKPDPSGAIEIARCLNVSPADFIYLGDTAIDMQTATASGMFPAGATWGFRSEKNYRKTATCAAFKTPLEVMGLLDLE